MIIFSDIQFFNYSMFSLAHRQSFAASQILVDVCGLK
jgi:hypothetical protein